MEYSSDALAQAAYASSSKISDPLAHWKMNDNAASTLVVDEIGSYNGTAAQNTSVLHTAGKINDALSFNGSSDNISLPSSLYSSNFANRKAKCSLSLWIKPSSVSGRRVLMWIGYWAIWIEFNYVSENKFDFAVTNTQGTTVYAVSTTGVANNTWFHIVGTYDQSNVKIYVNGSIENSVSFSDQTLRNIGNDAYIGKTPDDYFQGIIDDVRIYDFALTAAEVECLYNAGNGTEDRNPVYGLQCYSESSIKVQGSYSLKAIAKKTDSLNQTLTRTISSPIDLSNQSRIKFDIRSSRTGTNIQAQIRDSGGTYTTKDINISTADTWQTVDWLINGVSNSNKDAIDRIVFKILNADDDNTFYVDNMYSSPIDFTKSFSETISLSDTIAKSSTKTFTESINLSEPYFSKGIEREFTETIHLSDTISRAISKVFHDTITLTEYAVKNISLFFTETINLSDNIAKGIGKTFTERISLSDVFTKSLFWAKKVFTPSIWSKKDKGEVIWHKKSKGETIWKRKT